MDNKQPNQTIEFPSPLVQRESDDEIAKRALSLLRWKIRYNAIRVKAEKGHVTLSGEVSWDLDREAAEHAVRRLSGVTSLRIVSLSLLGMGADCLPAVNPDFGCRLTRPQDALKKLAKDAKAKSLYPRRSPSRRQTSM